VAPAIGRQEGAQRSQATEYDVGDGYQEPTLPVSFRPTIAEPLIVGRLWLAGTLFAVAERVATSVPCRIPAAPAPLMNTTARQNASGRGRPSTSRTSAASRGS
jgi:hypothetical protein